MNDIIPEALRRGDEYLDRVDELPVSRDQDPAVIRRILEHLKNKEPADSQARLPPERAPPQASCR